MTPLVYTAVFDSATQQCTFTLSGLTTSMTVVPSWGDNINTPSGNLYVVSPRVDGSAVIKSDIEQAGDRNIIVTVYPVEATPSGANDIISLDAVKRYLKIPLTDTTLDIFFASLIFISSDKIERYIRGPVAIQTYTGEICDGNGLSKLELEHQPISALANAAATDVQYRNDPLEAWQTLEAEVGYIVIKTSRPWHIHLFQTVFPAGDQNIKINYKAGYGTVADGTIPGVFQQVCLEMVVEMYKQSNNGTGRLGETSRGVSSQSGNANTSFVDLTEKHRELLTSYVRITP